MQLKAELFDLLKPNLTEPTHNSFLQTTSSHPLNPSVIKEERKIHHKMTEQRRRDMLKHYFDALFNILPKPADPSGNSTIKSMNRVDILQNSYQFIQTLLAIQAQKDQEIQQLKTQLSSLLERYM